MSAKRINLFSTEEPVSTNVDTAAFDNMLRASEGSVDDELNRELDLMDQVLEYEKEVSAGKVDVTGYDDKPFIGETPSLTEGPKKNDIWDILFPNRKVLKYKDQYGRVITKGVPIPDQTPSGSISEYNPSLWEKGSLWASGQPGLRNLQDWANFPGWAGHMLKKVRNVGLLDTIRGSGDAKDYPRHQPWMPQIPSEVMDPTNRNAYNVLLAIEMLSSGKVVGPKVLQALEKIRSVAKKKYTNFRIGRDLRGMEKNLARIQKQKIKEIKDPNYIKKHYERPPLTEKEIKGRTKMRTEEFELAQYDMIQHLKHPRTQKLLKEDLLIKYPGLKKYKEFDEMPSGPERDKILKKAQDYKDSWDMDLTPDIESATSWLDLKSLMNRPIENVEDIILKMNKDPNWKYGGTAWSPQNWQSSKVDPRFNRMIEPEVTFNIGDPLKRKSVKGIAYHEVTHISDALLKSDWDKVSKALHPKLRIKRDKELQKLMNEEIYNNPNAYANIIDKLEPRHFYLHPNRYGWGLYYTNGQEVLSEIRALRAHMGWRTPDDWPKFWKVPNKLKQTSQWKQLIQIMPAKKIKELMSSQVKGLSAGVVLGGQKSEKSQKPEDKMIDSWQGSDYFTF